MSKEKKDIKSLPFNKLGERCSAPEADKEALTKNFAATFGVNKNAVWVYAQILAEIGKWDTVKVDDKYDGFATLKLNLKDNPTNQGYYFFVSCSTRFLTRQYEKDNRYYCALVPLVMAAFKKYRDIPYSKWVNYRYLMDPKLYEAVSCEVPEYTTEYLLERRKNGIQSNYTSLNAYKVTGPKPTVDIHGNEVPGLTSLPDPLRAMLCQTWCAHPANRNEYMILDPKDFDNMPEPLVTHEIAPEIPWDLGKATDNHNSWHTILPTEPTQSFSDIDW